MTVLGEVAQVVDCEHKTAPRTENAHFAYSIGTQAVRGGRLDIDRAKPVSKATYEQWTRRAVPASDDLIFSREAPMGEVGTVPRDPRVCLGQRTVLLRPDLDRIEPRFLLYALMAPEVQQWVRDNSVGSTVQHLNVADVRRVPIAFLPPLNEQRRIVDLLEDHLSRLDAAGSYLRSCTRRLEAMKRSLLADLHDGDVRLLGDLAVDAGYGTSAKCSVDGVGMPVVRIPNLIDGQVDLTDEKRVVDISTDMAKFMLSQGDLLIVRTNGSVDLIGKSAVVQPGINAAFASYLIRYRVREEFLRPKWVQAMLSAPQVRAQIVRLAASSAGQHNLSLGKLNGLQLPVPSLEVQDARLRRLGHIEDERHRLVDAVMASRRRAEALRRSLLAAAFSGRLTRNRQHLDAEELVSP